MAKPTLRTEIRFKSVDGEWSMWYWIYSDAAKKIIKHLNWGAIDKIETR